MHELSQALALLDQLRELAVEYECLDCGHRTISAADQDECTGIPDSLRPCPKYAMTPLAGGELLLRQVEMKEHV